MTYRDFEESDYSDLREMMFCLYEEDPEGEPITDEKIRKTIAESKARPEKVRLVMICEDGEDGEDGRNAGYCILVYFWSNEYGGDSVVIDELYIKEKYRNRGIGSDFIKRQLADNERAVSLQIESTPSNSAAARLYERLGFEPSPNNHLILFNPSAGSQA